MDYYSVYYIFILVGVCEVLREKGRERKGEKERKREGEKGRERKEES